MSHFHLIALRFEFGFAWRQVLHVGYKPAMHWHLFRAGEFTLGTGFWLCGSGSARIFSFRSTKHESYRIGFLVIDAGSVHIGGFRKQSFIAPSTVKSSAVSVSVSCTRVCVHAYDREIICQVGSSRRVFLFFLMFLLLLRLVSRLVTRHIGVPIGVSVGVQMSRNWFPDWCPDLCPGWRSDWCGPDFWCPDLPERVSRV
jgi:hypothetical protein